MKLCGFEAGLDQPLFLIAGPCVIESEQLAIDTAGQLKEIAAELGIPFIYKSSFDKANRSSHESFRGPGMEEGLRILQNVKDQIGVPVLTDVHEDTPLNEVAAVVDVLQTPAFLCRQLSFPGLSISNPCTSCLIVPTRSPIPDIISIRRVITWVLPDPEYPTIHTQGGGIFLFNKVFICLF